MNPRDKDEILVHGMADDERKPRPDPTRTTHLDTAWDDEPTFTDPQFFANGSKATEDEGPPLPPPRTVPPPRVIGKASVPPPPGAAPSLARGASYPPPGPASPQRDGVSRGGGSVDLDGAQQIPPAPPVPVPEAAPPAAVPAPAPRKPGASVAPAPPKPGGSVAPAPPKPTQGLAAAPPAPQPQQGPQPAPAQPAEAQPVPGPGPASPGPAQAAPAELPADAPALPQPPPVQPAIVAPASAPAPVPLIAPSSPDLPVGLGQHLGRKVLIGPFAVPAWTLPVLTLFGTALFTGIVTAVVVGFAASPSEPAPAPAASSAASTPPADATDVPVVELAAAGDPDAMAKLEAKPAGARSVDEVVALASGEAVKRKAELGTLANDLRRNPNLGNDPDVLDRLREATDNDELAREALRIMATLPGSKPVDVMYEIWVGTRKRTPTTELAEQLVYTKEVREKASPALAVALDLRAAETCEEAKPVVARAVEHGDRRSLRLLGKLTMRYGCGKHKSQDCWACLRGEDTLTDALKAVGKRPAPKL